MIFGFEPIVKTAKKSIRSQASVQKTSDEKCPKCGSGNIGSKEVAYGPFDGHDYVCTNCGNTWDEGRTWQNQQATGRKSADLSDQQPSGPAGERPFLGDDKNPDELYADRSDAQDHWEPAFPEEEAKYGPKESSRQFARIASAADSVLREHDDSLWSEASEIGPVPPDPRMEEWFGKDYEFADQHAHDIDWMTAEERDQYGRNADRQRAIATRKVAWTIEDINNALEKGFYDSKVDGTRVDHFTLSAIQQVYNALSPESQASFSALPLIKASDVAFKLIKKNSSRKVAEGEPDCEHGGPCKWGKDRGSCPFCGRYPDEEPSRKTADNGVRLTKGQTIIAGTGAKVDSRDVPEGTKAIVSATFVLAFPPIPSYEADVEGYGHGTIYGEWIPLPVEKETTDPNQQALFANRKNAKNKNQAYFAGYQDGGKKTFNQEYIDDPDYIRGFAMGSEKTPSFASRKVAAYDYNDTGLDYPKCMFCEGELAGPISKPNENAWGAWQYRCLKCGQVQNRGEKLKNTASHKNSHYQVDWNGDEYSEGFNDGRRGRQQEKDSPKYLEGWDDGDRQLGDYWQAWHAERDRFERDSRLDSPKTAADVNYGGGPGSDDPGIDFDYVDAGHKAICNGMGTDGICEVCGKAVLFDGFGPGDRYDPNTEELWAHVKLSPKSAAVTSPGYYLTSANGSTISGPYPTPSEALAEVASNRGSAVEYKSGQEDPQWNEMKPKAFFPGSNTVNGSRKIAGPPHTDTICPGSGKIDNGDSHCPVCDQESPDGWQTKDGFVRKWHSDSRDTPYEGNDPKNPDYLGNMDDLLDSSASRKVATSGSWEAVGDNDEWGYWKDDDSEAGSISHSNGMDPPYQATTFAGCDPDDEFGKSKVFSDSASAKAWIEKSYSTSASRKIAGWVTDPGYNDSSVGGDQIFDQGSSRGCVWHSIEGDWGWSIGGPIDEDGEWEDDAEDSVSGTADDEASAKRQVEQYLNKSASRKVADVQPPCTACGMPCAPGDIYCEGCGSANDRSAWMDISDDDLDWEDDQGYVRGTGHELAENHYGSRKFAVDYSHTISGVQWNRHFASDDPSVSQFETPKDQTASPTGGNVGEAKDYDSYHPDYDNEETKYNGVTPQVFEPQQEIGVS